MSGVIVKGHDLDDEQEVVRGPAQNKAHHNSHNQADKAERAAAASARQTGIGCAVAKDDDQ